MMRLVIGKLLALVERYPPLVDGAFVIIAWVGVKLLIEYLHAEGYIALRGPEVALARPDRRDLRRRAGLRAAEATRSRRATAEADGQTRETTAEPAAPAPAGPTGSRWRCSLALVVGGAASRRVAVALRRRASTG